MKAQFRQGHGGFRKWLRKRSGGAEFVFVDGEKVGKLICQCVYCSSAITGRTLDTRRGDANKTTRHWVRPVAVVALTPAIGGGSMDLYEVTCRHAVDRAVTLADRSTFWLALSFDDAPRPNWPVWTYTEVAQEALF